MVKNMNSEVSPPILHPGLIIYQLMASSKLLNLSKPRFSHKQHADNKIANFCPLFPAP